LPFRVSYREEGKSRITFRIFGKTEINPSFDFSRKLY